MCNFSVDFTSSPDALVNKLKTAIANQGGTFPGDSTGGTFSVHSALGNVAGHYTITDQTLNVVIEHRPLLVSCGQIESYLRNFISA